jgi:formylglycine-generating enzyme required for sulfatase activity
LLNFDRIHAGTTPVGFFPDGASPYGALDMAGNV